jgi:hypothetical protein
MKLGTYAKFLVAIAGQALATAELYFPGNRYVAIGVAVASAIAVYAVPNSPKG